MKQVPGDASVLWIFANKVPAISCMQNAKLQFLC